MGSSQSTGGIKLLIFSSTFLSLRKRPTVIMIISKLRHMVKLRSENVALLELTHRNHKFAQHQNEPVLVYQVTIFGTDIFGGAPGYFFNSQGVVGLNVISQNFWSQFGFFDQTCEILSRVLDSWTKNLLFLTNI